MENKVASISEVIDTDVLSSPPHADKVSSNGVFGAHDATTKYKTEMAPHSTSGVSGLFSIKPAVTNASNGFGISNLVLDSNKSQSEHSRKRKRRNTKGEAQVTFHMSEGLFSPFILQNNNDDSSPDTSEGSSRPAAFQPAQIQGQNDDNKYQVIPEAAPIWQSAVRHHTYEQRAKLRAQHIGTQLQEGKVPYWTLNGDKLPDYLTPPSTQMIDLVKGQAVQLAELAKNELLARSEEEKRLYTSHLNICSTIYTNENNPDFNKAAERLGGIVGHYRTQEKTKLEALLVKEEARRPKNDEEVGKLIQDRGTGGTRRPRPDTRPDRGYAAAKRPRNRDQSDERAGKTSSRRKAPPQSCPTKGNHPPPPPPPATGAIAKQANGYKGRNPKQQGRKSPGPSSPGGYKGKGKAPFPNKGKGKGPAYTSNDTKAIMSAIQALVERVEAR